MPVGFGKTATLLNVISRTTELLGPYLVVAPLRVCETVWAQEAKEWEFSRRLKFSMVLGTAKKREKALREEADVYVINYENLAWLEKRKILPFQAIIYDEASKLGNPQSLVSKVGARLHKKVGSVISSTATPASNGLVKLFGQYRAVDGGKRLGRFVTHFRTIFCSCDYSGYNWTVMPAMVPALYHAIEDITFSLKPDEEAPRDIPVSHQDIIIPINPAIRRQYMALKKDMVADIGNEKVTTFNAGTLVSKLMQFCNGAVYREDGSFIEVHDAKLNALKELVEELDGEPILIMYHFKSDYKRIKSLFPTAVEIRDSQSTEIIRDWNAGEIPILLGHPASCGHGLNLQYGGNHLCWFGLPFDLELYQQANGRLARNGQDRQVIIHKLMIENTIEQKCALLLEKKRVTQQELLDAITDA